MTTKRLAAFTVFLVSLTWTIQTEAKHLHFRHRRQQQADCLTSSRTAGRCVPFQQCVIKGGRFPGRPAICRWELEGPVICCPDESKENSLTCGLSLIPSAVRQRRQTTFDDVTETASGETVTFVIGGEDAVMGKWPWMALIYHEDDKRRRSPICGASLISDTALLTAAHCFLGRMNPTFVVRLGEHDLRKSKAVEVKVKKVISHPGFQYPALYDDIAILHLETKVAFTNGIGVVCLPKNFKNETFESKRATVTGWGNLEFGGKRANILQQLEMPIVPNSHCQKRYKGMAGAKPNLPNGISNKMLCAGYEDAAKDSCQGDSGGPLVYQGSSDNWFQIGIVSAGFECGSGVPGLYTRVTEYLDWIAENTA